MRSPLVVFFIMGRRRCFLPKGSLKTGQWTLIKREGMSGGKISSLLKPCLPYSWGRVWLFEVNIWKGINMRSKMLGNSLSAVTAAKDHTVYRWDSGPSSCLPRVQVATPGRAAGCCRLLPAAASFALQGFLRSSSTVQRFHLKTFTEHLTVMLLSGGQGPLKGPLYSFPDNTSL